MVLVVKNPPDAADTGDEGKFSSCLEQTVKAQRGGSIQLSQADSVIESRVILGDAALNSVSSVVSDSLRPHGLKHARPPCPSGTNAPVSALAEVPEEARSGRSVNGPPSCPAQASSPGAHPLSPKRLLPLKAWHAPSASLAPLPVPGRSSVLL